MSEEEFIKLLDRVQKYCILKRCENCRFNNGLTCDLDGTPLDWPTELEDNK